MPGYRKLGRPADQRKAMLRGLVTSLVWNGRIETTEARAKEVQSIAEKLITLAIKECDNFEKAVVQKNNDKQQTVDIETRKDLPSRLNARRKMLAYLYDVPEAKQAKETKLEYRERTRTINHPVVEKLMGEIGPKYKKRMEEVGQGGGYTRMIKKGPRRGDAAEVVILELV